jgi:hypothetical protein
MRYLAIAVAAIPLGCHAHDASPAKAGRVQHETRPPSEGHGEAFRLTEIPGSNAGYRRFLYLNLNQKRGVGEFTQKDPDYAPVVIRELAKVLPE